MKIRTLGCLVALSAICSSFVSCKQASIACVAEHAAAGTYATQFFPKNAPECAAKTVSPAYSLIAGADVTLDKINYDSLGMETYHPSKEDGDNGTVPDFTKGSVAIESAALGGLVDAWDPMYADMSTDDKLYSLGDWTAASPDENDFCQVPSFKNQATQKFAKIPGVPADPMDPMSKPVPCTPGVDITLAWKNVQVYVTAAAQGTQFEADLTYTQVDHQVDSTAPDKCNPTTDATCAVDYHVRGVWPEIDCFAKVPDPSDPTGMKTMIVPDDEACCPSGCTPGHCGDAHKDDPTFARASGSGLSPDFPIKCDHTLLKCVLDAPADQHIPLIGAKANTALCGTSE